MPAGPSALRVIHGAQHVMVVFVFFEPVRFERKLVGKGRNERRMHLLFVVVGEAKGGWSPANTRAVRARPRIGRRLRPLQPWSVRSCLLAPRTTRCYRTEYSPLGGGLYLILPAGRRGADRRASLAQIAKPHGGGSRTRVLFRGERPLAGLDWCGPLYCRRKTMAHTMCLPAR
jgi:hypothetical protein